MSKITKKAIEEIKRSTNNKLTKKVCNVLLEKGTAEDVESYINDLLYGGCQSGVEGSLIYYSDTIAFYKKYQTEIKELLKEVLEETGFKSPGELFGEKWDNEDMFAEDTNNQNLLAWFGFEETARKIAYELDMDI
jgi:hypothetical protein